MRGGSRKIAASDTVAAATGGAGDLENELEVEQGIHITAKERASWTPRMGTPRHLPACKPEPRCARVVTYHNTT